MIIRDRANEIVMITQHDHAHLSGVFANHWKRSYFQGASSRESVELAIKEHDRAWIYADAQPFWNDQTNLPFSFMDFPLEAKLVFYKHGIDEVEKMDTYASLLCSAHYSRFIARDSGKEAKQFIRNELARQKRIKNERSNFNETYFNFHFDLVKFCDNLSLYVCLNERGTLKADEHYFFQKGLPISSSFSFLESDRIDIHWQDEDTIVLSDFPFEASFTIQVKQRVVSKDLVKEVGIKKAYEQTPLEMVDIQFKPMT